MVSSEREREREKESERERIAFLKTRTADRLIFFVFLFVFFVLRYNERHRLLLRRRYHHWEEWGETCRYYVQREVLAPHRAEDGQQYREVSTGLNIPDDWTSYRSLTIITTGVSHSAFPHQKPDIRRGCRLNPTSKMMPPSDRCHRLKRKNELTALSPPPPPHNARFAMSVSRSDRSSNSKDTYYIDTLRGKQKRSIIFWPSREQTWEESIPTWALYFL